MRLKLKKAIFLILVLCISLVVISIIDSTAYVNAEGEIIIIEHDTSLIDNPEYIDSGFSDSGLNGYPGTAGGSRTSGAAGSWAKWTPSSITPGVYKVYIWKIVRSSGQDTSVKVETVHNSKTEIYTLNQSGSAGWVELGVFYFVGNGTEYVKLTRTTTTGGGIYTQADSVKFEKIEVDKTLINVSIFGAQPDDMIEDGAAIREAIDTAIAMGNGATVNFSSGKYLVNPLEGTWKSGAFAFNYQNVDGLTLQGMNTELCFTDNFVGAFRFQASSNIKIAGLTIDYQNTPWSQGQVIDIDTDAGTFDFMPEEGYTSILDDKRLPETFAEGFGMIRDTNNPILLKKTAPDFFRIQSVQKLDSNIYRIGMAVGYKYLLGNANYIISGDKITINNRGIVGTSFRMVQCTNITLLNCNVYSSPGTAITGTYMNGYLKVDALKVMRKPDSGRWISANADAIHIQWMKGTVEVINCTFEGLSDDAINFYQVPAVINQIYSPTSILVSHSTRIPTVGEALEIFDPINGVSKGKAKVINVEPVPGYDPIKKAILNLDTSIPNMVAGMDVTKGDNVFNIEAQFPGTVITGNVFKEIRGRGVLLRTVDTTLENNQFTDISGVAISILYKTGSVGPGVNNLQIISNTFDNVVYLNDAKKSMVGAPIQIRGLKYDGTLADERIQRNIILRNNTILHSARYGIYIGNADNVQISGTNNITAYMGDLVLDGNISGIMLVNVKDVTISGLSITDPRPELKAGIELGSNCENVNINSCIYVLSDGVPDAATVGISDMFQNYTINQDLPVSAGWIRSGGGANVKVVSDPENHSEKCVVVQKIADSNEMYLRRDVSTALKGVIVIEYRVRVEDTAKKHLPEIIGRDHDDNEVVVINMLYENDASVQTGSTLHTTFPYMIDQWHTYKFLINTANDTFDLYKDGSLLVQGKKLGISIDCITAVNFMAGEVNSKLYFDDVRVYKICSNGNGLTVKDNIFKQGTSVIERIEHFVAGDELKNIVTIENASDEEKNITLMIAMYQRNILKKAMVLPQKILPGETVLEKIADLREEDLNGLSIKSFVWNDICSMKPLSTANWLK